MSELWHLQCRSERYEVHGDAAAPLFLTFVLMAQFDTTTRAEGGKAELCWRTHREFHPSEDLSELPPLLESVAGQGYHYRRTGSLRDRLPSLLLDGWEPLGTLFGRLLCRKPAQVVLAHPPHRFSLF